MQTVCIGGLGLEGFWGHFFWLPLGFWIQASAAPAFTAAQGITALLKASQASRRPGVHRASLELHRTSRGLMAAPALHRFWLHGQFGYSFWLQL